MYVGVLLNDEHEYKTKQKKSEIWRFKTESNTTWFELSPSQLNESSRNKDQILNFQVSEYNKKKVLMIGWNKISSKLIFQFFCCCFPFFAFDFQNFLFLLFPVSLFSKFFYSFSFIYFKGKKIFLFGIDRRNRRNRKKTDKQKLWIQRKQKLPTLIPHQVLYFFEYPWISIGIKCFWMANELDDEEKKQNNKRKLFGFREYIRKLNSNLFCCCYYFWKKESRMKIEAEYTRKRGMKNETKVKRNRKINWIVTISDLSLTPSLLSSSSILIFDRRGYSEFLYNCVNLSIRFNSFCVCVCLGRSFFFNQL